MKVEINKKMLRFDGKVVSSAAYLSDVRRDQNYLKSTCTCVFHLDRSKV
jgi:hypothetical protein